MPSNSFFERFLSPTSSPRRLERFVSAVVQKEMKKAGAHSKAAVRRAYRAAIELDTGQKLGLKREHVFNILRKQAHTAALSSGDYEMYRSLGISVNEFLEEEQENIRRQEEDS